jgi:hypothetical protein
MSSQNSSAIAADLKHTAAFSLMRVIFVLVPLLAGIDKYFNFITDWEKYVSPALKPFIPVSSKTVMQCAGVVEIGVGITTICRPRVGASMFAAMLGGISLNLLTMKKQLHIASLDICLATFALVFTLLLPEAEQSDSRAKP